MIDRVHQHIVSELQQGARTDTVFVVIAVLLNLLMLGISSGIAEGSAENGATTGVLGLFMALTVVVNLVAVFGLLKGKETRARLIGGLLKLYADQHVDGYYDPALLRNYGTRYYLFILTIVCMGIVAIAVPLLLR
ncbi:hypothetical protein JW848_02995 [Candidatus Bipolaricaulota bacterium]|nr:hypothetical protein [Candidatus Bipolaricaulota bacterium]